MGIEVSNTKTIDVIEREFHAEFPYLKIEFYQTGTSANSEDKNKVPGHKSFGTFKTPRPTGNISISPSLTVAELDKSFRRLFGISVLILRKSGKAWLETKLTDNWTLQEQNEQGKALSKTK